MQNNVVRTERLLFDATKRSVKLILFKKSARTENSLVQNERVLSKQEVEGNQDGYVIIRCCV